MDAKYDDWWIKFNINSCTVEWLEEEGYKVLRVEDKWIVCTIE